MDLSEKINIDLKDALKAGDKLRLKTVRSIRALILELIEFLSLFSLARSLTDS